MRIGDDHALFISGVPAGKYQLVFDALASQPGAAPGRVAHFEVAEAGICPAQGIDLGTLEVDVNSMKPAKAR